MNLKKLALILNIHELELKGQVKDKDCYIEKKKQLTGYKRHTKNMSLQKC